VSFALLAERFRRDRQQRNDGVARSTDASSRAICASTYRLAVVRLWIWRRRRVRRMGIVEVHPGEEGPAHSAATTASAVDDLGASLSASKVPLCRSRSDDLVVVALETAIESET